MGIEDVETFHRDSRLIDGANPTKIIIDDFVEAGKMDDNWKHRSEGMVCRTCMYFTLKEQSTPDDQPLRPAIGRCRRHAPSMHGWPVMFLADWCGDHKLDENKV